MTQIQIMEQMIPLLKKAVVLLTSLISLYTPQFGGIGDTPTSAVIGEKTINFSYTDENANEKLVIRTEKREYFGFGKFSIPFTITNNSQSQNVIVSIATQNDWIVDSIQKFVRNETVKVPSIPAVTTGSTTPEIIFPDIITAVWDSEILIKPSNISPKKSLANKTGAIFYMNANETAIFRVIFQKAGIGEFIIEAFGSTDSYGNLDPWIYEDKFNSDTKSIGSLNGQDGWVTHATGGGGDWSVQTTDKFEGDQGVTTGSHAKGDVYADTVIADVIAGTVYIAIMRGAYSGGSNLHPLLKHGTTYNIHLDLSTTNTDVGYYTRNQASRVSFGTWTQDVWGVLKIIFDFSTDTMNLQWYNGTSWGTATGDVQTTFAGDHVDTIQFLSTWASGDGIQDDSFDIITPTDPTVAPPAVYVAPLDQTYFFDEE